MAATMSGTYSATPDTPSPVYPDRLIRPLPKRPLRSRLSPEAAGSILYPPAPPVSQLFYGSYSDHGESRDNKAYMQQHVVDPYGHDHSPDRDQRHPYENGVSEVESGDEGSPVVVRRSAGFRGSSLSPSTPVPNGQAQPVAQSPGGPDGYDAFENTNNKKKRKIPTSGTLNSHHSSLTSDLASMGISGSSAGSPAGLADTGAGTYYGSGSPATSNVGNGISGPGRGRYGRHAPRAVGSRNSLPVHSQNTWLGGRPGNNRRDLPSSPHLGTGEIGAKSDQGIISTAIANAAALSPSPKGGNNVSLLDQQSSKTSPTKTQFTFTCESDSSKSIALHPPNPYPLSHQRIPNPSMPATASNSRDFATQGTQTSPHMGAVAGQQQPPLPGAGTPTNNPGQRPRRSRDSIYALAARRRKIQQHYANIHNPPNPEDIWICEFCEYETIFGEPPKALIRQYEIKDRKERRRLAEKRRLLEKAKMKGRKNKKATKNAAKHPNAQQPTHHASDHHAMDAPRPDDYLGEYDDEIPPMGAPAPPQQNFSRPPAAVPSASRSPPVAGPIPPEGTAGSGGTNRPA